MRHACYFVVVIALFTGQLTAGEKVYRHTLEPVSDPRPILADHAAFVAPIDEATRLRAPILIDDEDADLTVDSWRFNYNARGIIEVPNRLKGSKTAIVVVHPWGIDDGQGWKTPEPAGVAFACTPQKNALMLEHARLVLNPFLQKMRPLVGLVVYSLPGEEDPIRAKLYRGTSRTPSDSERGEGARELAEKLASFKYEGAPLRTEIPLTSGRPAIDYFRALPGLEAYEPMNPEGFWDLPIPVMKPIDISPRDVVLYDKQGYDALRRFLQSEGIEHVLLCGYHADMCVCSTTAGYENLKNHFNVFLVGDGVQATLPANSSARHSTNQAVAMASLKVLITQVSWVRPLDTHTASAKVD